MAPTSTDALLDVAEVVAASSGSVSIDDPRLPRLIAGASQAVRRYCRWHVTPVITETVVVDHAGGSLLAVPSGRLLSVEAVSVWDGAAYVPVEGGFRKSKAGLVQLGSSVRAGYEALEVTMTHGFTRDEAADLLQVVTQMVLVALSSPMGATREQAGGVSFAWALTAPGVAGGLSLLARDRAVVDAYRLTNLPGR